MSDDIKDMIKNAMDKNASAFEDAFGSLMSDKMEVALSKQYDSLFGGPVEESVEAEEIQENDGPAK